MCVHIGVTMTSCATIYSTLSKCLFGQATLLAMPCSCATHKHTHTRTHTHTRAGHAQDYIITHVLSTRTVTHKVDTAHAAAASRMRNKGKG
jgi:hypothetical protein